MDRWFTFFREFRLVVVDHFFDLGVILEFLGEGKGGVGEEISIFQLFEDLLDIFHGSSPLIFFSLRSSCRSQLLPEPRQITFIGMFSRHIEEGGFSVGKGKIEFLRIHPF